MGIKIPPPSDAADAPPTLLTAMREQLGLKLSSEKTPGICGPDGTGPLLEAVKNDPPCRSNTRVIKVYVPAPPGSGEKD